MNTFRSAILARFALLRDQAFQSSVITHFNHFAVCEHNGVSFDADAAEPCPSYLKSKPPAAVWRR
jgi:hypothetical protein